MLCSCLGWSADELRTILAATPQTCGAIDGREGVQLAADEARRRRGKLSRSRRTWAESLLAAHAPLREQRALHTYYAGNPREARRLIDSIAPPVARIDLEIELREQLLESKLTRAEERAQRIALARAYFVSDRIPEAAALLESLGASRTRDRALRLFWASILNRQGKYAESLRRTRSLLQSRDSSSSRIELLDLHARNLLLLGRGHAAVEALTRELGRPGPTTSLGELRLHLTRDRCARESDLRIGADRRTLDLARVVREARRRRADGLVAEAAFRVGVALSDAGWDERALRWLERARQVWIGRGDEYRSAEIENSIGVLQHKLERVADAHETYESATRRLTRLGETRPLAIVHMNHADLLIDVLDAERATSALRFAMKALGEGVLRFKAQLMLLDIGLENRAAPELTLSRLDELAADSDYERPAVRAYLESLRARALTVSGRLRAATRTYEQAADLYRAAGRKRAAATALATAASLQDDVRLARGFIARALIDSRSDPPHLVEVARSTISNRKIVPKSSRLPLTTRRAREITERLRALVDGKPPLMAAATQGAHRELARIFARASEAAHPDVASFLTDIVGAPRWAVFEKGPVESHVLLQSRDLGIADALNGRSPVASRVLLQSERFLVVLVHPEIELRFGMREDALVRELLELLELRASAARNSHSAPPAKPASAPHEGAKKIASQHRPSGRSTTMRKLREDARHLARSRLPLVLVGESGTGKDRLARYIHDCSDRAAGPFIVVDCAALPEQLAEAQLVGHERGAFTGAEASRRGLLNAAHGGTLVLDRVERLPQRAQSLLLRVLENGRLRALGAVLDVSVSIRVITLGTRPLAVHRDEGRLRSELAWHLGGAELRLPALRERSDDIAVLLREMILEENASRPRSVSSSAIAALQREEWPGNLTELRNRVRRALLLTPQQEPLGLALFGDAAPADTGREPAVRLAARLRAVERRFIAEALDRHGGHRERSAKSLGISRRWLQKRIRELELS